MHWQDYNDVLGAPSVRLPVASTTLIDTVVLYFYPQILLKSLFFEWPFPHRLNRIMLFERFLRCPSEKPGSMTNAARHPVNLFNQVFRQGEIKAPGFTRNCHINKKSGGHKRIRFNLDLIKQRWQRDVFALFNHQRNMPGQTFSGVLIGFRLGISSRSKAGKIWHKNRILRAGFPF